MGAGLAAGQRVAQNTQGRPRTVRRGVDPGAWSDRGPRLSHLFGPSTGVVEDFWGFVTRPDRGILARLCRNVGERLLPHSLFAQRTQ